MQSLTILLDSVLGAGSEMDMRLMRRVFARENHIWIVFIPIYNDKYRHGDIAQTKLIYNGARVSFV